MEGGSHVVRIGICDSHDIALAGLKSTLSGHGLIVEATARTCAQALALADASHGVVVLVDIDLKSGEVSAGDVIERVTAAGGIPIATGVSGDPSVLFRALRWGARGYLTKDLPTRAWADAIRAAARGEALVCRSMTAALIDEYRSVARSTPVGELLPSDRRLTPREWQVLELVAEGKTNRIVAADLSISEETVRTHVSKILNKLETPNRSAAAARYHRLRAAR
jgi:DNA-binding NarL/FixJ family response regulator